MIFKFKAMSVWLIESVTLKCTHIHNIVLFIWHTSVVGCNTSKRGLNIASIGNTSIFLHLQRLYLLFRLLPRLTIRLDSDVSAFFPFFNLQSRRDDVSLPCPNMVIEADTTPAAAERRRAARFEESWAFAKNTLLSSVSEFWVVVLFGFFLPV